MGEEPVDARKARDSLSDVEVASLLIPLRMHVVTWAIEVSAEKLPTVCDGRPYAVELPPVLALSGGDPLVHEVHELLRLPGA